MSFAPKKSLGQHWLYDPAALQAVCDAAHIKNSDTVLEIGPGLGTLTNALVERAKHVTAVEFDRDLASELSSRVTADNLEIINQDFLQFDLGRLPSGYKVAANVPYYITSKIVRLLLESDNPPAEMALLIQKEVAERMAAKPGGMSILAVATQFYAVAKLGPVIPAELFTPPPKVNSRIISLKYRKKPLFADVVPAAYFRMVRAGFGEKRKTLRNSLSGGLRIDKSAAEALLHAAHISPGARAEQLSLDEWHVLTVMYATSQT